MIGFNPVDVTADDRSTERESYAMDELQAFLFEHVDTFEALDVLVRVYRHRDRDWTADAIAADVNLTPELAAEALEHLEAHGLVERQPTGFRYHAATDALDAAVQRIVQVYASERLTIIQFMATNALDRLRTSANQRFADAFRLRGKKDG